MTSIRHLLVRSIVVLLSTVALSPSLGFLSCGPTPIMVDEFKVTDVSLDEAIEALRIKTRLLDKTESDQIKKGVNIILKGVRSEQRMKKVSLELRQVPVAFIIESLCKLSGLRMKLEPFAVVIEPTDAPRPMETRIYKLPPDFLRTGATK